MATIQYLKLDPENDFIWIPQSALTDTDAVAQAILTRLRLFEGEWWENLNLGLPMFQQILGAPGSLRQQQVIELLISQQIQGTPYVSNVLNATVSFNAATRAFTYKADVQTAFGPITVTFSPGTAGSVVN